MVGVKPCVKIFCLGVGGRFVLLMIYCREKS